jgi:hypothetical protein
MKAVAGQPSPNCTGRDESGSILRTEERGDDTNPTVSAVDHRYSPPPIECGAGMTDAETHQISYL